MSTDDPADDGTRPATGESRPRRRRRAVGGTPAPDPVAPGTDPLLPGRSADDSDQGWSERPGTGDGDDDERLRREVPPHW